MEIANPKIDAIAKRYMAANPLFAHFAGIHDYDGKLPNFNFEEIDERLAELEEDLTTMASLLEAELTKLTHFEYLLIKYRLETEKFTLSEQREFTKSPLPYIYPFGIIEVSYATRSFATVDERVRFIIEIERQIPGYFKVAMNNLDDSLAKVKIEISIEFLQGTIQYFKDDLISFVSKVNDSELLNTWSEVNHEAVIEMEGFIDKLKSDFLPRAHNDFRLGKEKFLRLLSKTENVELDYEVLLKAGEEDLERNFQALAKIVEERGKEYLESIDNDHPNIAELVSEADATLERTMQFLLDKDIVTLPTTKHCTVIETPKFARKFAFAAMNTPGPFEIPEASEAYYWITPPDSSWPPERQKQFMKFFSRAFLEMVTIHEVWPGHYLQLLYNKNSKSVITKAFARSISMIEGWAHYCEEMIYEAGYEPFDRTKLHVGQLKGALTRNCRYVAALKMHCEDMTVEEAKNFFMEKSFIQEPVAMIEARRGTIDPMYLNYTLGKLLIKKLRDEYKQQSGDSFSLKEFHDTMLSYASPPIVALRQLLLDSPSSEIL